MVAPSKTESGPTLVTIPVVIKPNPLNKEVPDVMVPDVTEANNGDILCWEVQNSFPADLWIEFNGFLFQPNLSALPTVSIPSLFNNFESYGASLPAGTTSTPSLTTSLGGEISNDAPLGSSWAYTILIIGDQGLIISIDPIVVLSGDDKDVES
jgi:hypothetical protein